MYIARPTGSLEGESVSSLIANPPAGAPVPPILPPVDGFLFLDKAQFAASLAADVDPEAAAFMADSQVPRGVEALAGAVTVPAWKKKPSYYLVAADDRMIPPPAQRMMAARWGKDRRNRWHPCRLRLKARGGGEAHRRGRQRLKQSPSVRDEAPDATVSGAFLFKLGGGGPE
ncbi:hypothetical protein NKI56_36215 [Mesorhizobium sp. M0622]|uniref:hypothetical protein n=1 Tax=unclassified Mesorhizobium TaxID=325217 RepID=UPI003336CF76